ncbi:MAG TPA: hypothetical protein VIU85_04405 [Chthoniobacterales bacterium]
MSIFAALHVYHDLDSRSAALNMAIDEALLETASAPTIRFYRWDHPALSFGYFGRLSDVEKEKRDIVRRWTGGGIVLHGDDLTYSIVIPASDAAFGESSMSIYEQVHRAIQITLGSQAKLATVAAVSDRRDQNQSAIGDRRYNECFANPVKADVMIDGTKIAGAAQRRTRRGLLQQGSIQNIDLAPDFEKSLAGHLSQNCIERTIEQAHVERAQQIATEKYAAAAWLRRR